MGYVASLVTVAIVGGIYAGLGWQGLTGFLIAGVMVQVSDRLHNGYWNRH